MGLGKTPQSLAWLQLHPEARPAVIVCPASLKYNWLQEIKKFMTGTNPQVIDGGIWEEYHTGKYERGKKKKDGSFRRGKKIMDKRRQELWGDIIIVNYDVLPDDTKQVWTGKYRKYPWHHRLAGRFIRKNGQKQKEMKRVDIPETGWWSYIDAYAPVAVILDECHYIKTKDSLRTNAVLKMVEKAKHVIALSGTPLLNRPVELYNPVNAVSPHLFPSFFDFAKRYCGAFKGKYGWDYTGCTNTEELHKTLTSTCMIRRLKKDVMPELPPKVRTVVPLELTNRITYQRAEDAFIEYLQSFDSAKAQRAKQAEQLVKLEVLKKLAVDGKLGSCIKWIEDFLESGEKLVVFAHHKDVIQKLEKRFKKICVKIDGGVSPKNRQKAVNKFQNDAQCTLFLGNLDAASVGLTLTAASNTCFIEFGWTPGVMVQAEDRVHRIGQEADSVNAWYLTAINTIEADIIRLVEKKARILDQILDGADASAGSIFDELLENW